MTVAILPADDAEAAVWATSLEVARLFSGLPWVLVGGQMVMLLEREAGRPSGRTTGDVDAVVDVRVVVGGTRTASQRLVAAGFDMADPRHSYRFVRGASQVDLLAPDNVGDRADLTTIPPATTTTIPGGTRALQTARQVPIDVVGVGSGVLPVPSLAGAIVLKTGAWHDRRAARDAEDLVRLLALVDDVESMRADFEPKERRRLGAVTPLADPAHSAWLAGQDPEEANLAWERLKD
jgi:predicted nucleotidyltransferase